MNTTIKIAVRRDAFTLIEMMVVIAIILALAALAAAFAPRVNENQKMTRAVDNLEQWLLIAKMRAKRDGLATGLRFIQAPGDALGTYSQFQYIQQPEPIVGGYISGAGPVGGTIVSAGGGTVTFGNVDFSLGLIPPLDAFGRQQWLVQTGDYLEINGGGVFSIWGVVVPAAPPANTLVLGGLLQPTAPSTYLTNGWNTPSPVTVVAQVPVPYPTPTFSIGALATFSPPPPSAPGSPLTTIISPLSPPWVMPPVGSFLWQSQYEQSLSLAATTNYRILRQPRILLGEEPLTLPNNYAVDMRIIPGLVPLSPPVILQNSVIPNNTIIQWSNVFPGSSGFPEILFSPSGAVIGSNASSSMIFLTVYDMTMNPFDINMVGIVGLRTRTGFLGAYGATAGAGLPGYNPFFLAQAARESGL